MVDNGINEVILYNYKKLFIDALNELKNAKGITNSQKVEDTITAKITVLSQGLNFIEELEDEAGTINAERRNISELLKNYYNIATRSLVEYRYETNLDFIIDLYEY